MSFYSLFWKLCLLHSQIPGMVFHKGMFEHLSIMLDQHNAYNNYLSRKMGKIRAVVYGVGAVQRCPQHGSLLRTNGKLRVLRCLMCELARLIVGFLFGK